MTAPRNSIKKGISLLLMMVMLQSYFCSAFCAVGALTPCSKSVEKHCCHRTCCDKKNKIPNSGCQKEHLAFFKNIGRYHTTYSVAAINPFQLSLLFQDLQHPFKNICAVSIVKGSDTYHPPPLINLKPVYLLYNVFLI